MKIKVLSKKVVTTNEKGKENIFFRYFSPCNIQVIDKDGNDLGIQEKSVSVHFTKDALKKLDEEQVFAFFESNNPEDIGLPYILDERRYNTDEESLNYIWIRGWEKKTKIPYKGKQSTCVPVLEDESESEPVEIVE